MMIIVKIVIGVRLLTLASLRSDPLLRLRLVLMVFTTTGFLSHLLLLDALFVYTYKPR